MPRKRNIITISGPEEYNALITKGTLKKLIDNGATLEIKILLCQPVCSEVRKYVLAYVDKIKAFATPAYRDKIEEVWLKVMDEPVFMEMLMPTGKARCKKFNKHNLMGMIGVMRNKNVYREELTNKELCLVLEPDDNETYRSSMSKGVDKLFREFETLINL